MGASRYSISTGDISIYPKRQDIQSKLNEYPVSSFFQRLQHVLLSTIRKRETQMIGVLIGIPVFVLLTAGVVIVVLLRKPSRHYSGPGSVSSVYDTWTADQKMKFYWGNHLHAGFYGQPPEHKNFIRAKLDMIDEMVRWGIAQPDPRLIERLENPVANAPRIKILDVGSGMGGTALHLAQRWPKSAHITGITISSAQTTHATRLAHASGLCNVTFVECDAMDSASPLKVLTSSGRLNPKSICQTRNASCARSFGCSNPTDGC